jgi:hypothetical protein
LQIVPAPTGGALYLNAVLHNAGNSAITGAQVTAQFEGKNGTLKTVTAPVQGMQGTANATDLTQDPIKPNESRPVSIYVDRPPTGWNHQVPEITVQTVTGTTPK